MDDILILKAECYDLYKTIEKLIEENNQLRAELKLREGDHRIKNKSSPDSVILYHLNKSTTGQ